MFNMIASKEMILYENCEVERRFHSQVNSLIRVQSLEHRTKHVAFFSISVTDFLACLLCSLLRRLFLLTRYFFCISDVIVTLFQIRSTRGRDCHWFWPTQETDDLYVFKFSWFGRKINKWKNEVRKIKRTMKIRKEAKMMKGIWKRKVDG
jgi:hypothetical protein